MTKILAFLSAPFPEAETDEATKLAKLRAYLIALEPYSVAVMEEAVRRVFTNKSGFDARFMPTPPQMAKLCDDVRADYHCAAARRTEDMLAAVGRSADLSRFDAPPDPRVAAKFDALKVSLQTFADAGPRKREWSQGRDSIRDLERHTVEAGLERASRQPEPVSVSEELAAHPLTRRVGGH